MVYLIGVNHDVQFKEGEPETDRFIACLKRKIKELNIVLVAEESSDDAKEVHEVETTTIEDIVNEEIAKGSKIEYIAFDATLREREKHGIPSEKDIIFRLFKGNTLICLSHEQVKLVDQEKAKYHLKREKIWFKKIRDRKHQEMIFICGFVHLSKYNPLRKKNGFDKLLIKNGWKVNFLELFLGGKF